MANCIIGEGEKDDLNEQQVKSWKIILLQSTKLAGHFGYRITLQKCLTGQIGIRNTFARVFNT